MTRKIAPIAVLALLVFGCGRSGKMQRGQQQYEVVQEGSASGVTSTINGPGETTPPLTNTNVDTTTNFTLPNPNPLGNDTIGGSMASSLPPTTSYPVSRPRTSTRPAPVTNAPVVTDTIGSTTPPMPKERSAPPREQTDTSIPTDTTATAPPPTDTSSTQPPPPPPPTDTTGTRG